MSVKKLLYNYKQYKLTLDTIRHKLIQINGNLPSITASYSLTPPTQTNENHSTTEKTAVKNVTEEEPLINRYNEIKYAVDVIEKALANLEDRELEIIELKYFKRLNMYRVATEAKTDVKYAYRLHSRAMKKLEPLAYVTMPR